MKKLLLVVLASITLSAEPFTVSDVDPHFNIVYFENGAILQGPKEFGFEIEIGRELDFELFDSKKCLVKLITVDGEQFEEEKLFTCVGNPAERFSSVAEFREFIEKSNSLPYYLDKIELKAISADKSAGIMATGHSIDSMDPDDPHYNETFRQMVDFAAAFGETLSSKDIINLHLRLQGYSPDFMLKDLLENLTEDHRIMGGQAYKIDDAYSVNEIIVMRRPDTDAITHIYFDTPGHPDGGLDRYLAFVQVKLPEDLDLYF